MSNPAPGDPAADRNLLFGILAVQMDFVSRDALIAGMHAWVLAKHRPLGEILVEQLALSAAHRELLEPLVDAHLRGHGNDPARSLAALGSSAAPALGALQQLQDGDVQASLRQIAGTMNTDGNPNRTLPEPPAARPRFRILRPHAKGGLGEVFVAHDDELNRPVALKEIQTRHAGNRDSRGRFLLEAEITGRLEHPGIVPVYGLGTYADGRPFYAMRFIEGQDLREAIERFHGADKPGRDAGERRIAFRELLGRFVDVCNSVAFAHNKGVLHRDLKPGNVMLGKYGETLVVDWGLAKAAGQKDDATAAGSEAMQPRSGSDVTPTQHGSALGTPAYMSPEQAAGRLDKLGTASDVYSLGATLYTILTGQPPVTGADVGEVLRKVQRGEIAPAGQVKPGAPAALDAISRKAMSLEPGDRYASALELAADVEHWLADEPVAAWREPWSVRAGRWVRRHQPLVAGAAALFLAAMPLCVVIAVNSNAARQRAERDGRAILEQKEAAESNAEAARLAENEARRQQQFAEANEKAAKERETETRAVLDFVENKVFAAARPEGQAGGLGREVTLRKALEAVLPAVGQSFRQQPLIEARLRMTLANSFFYLGDLKIAADEYEAARKIRTEHLGPKHPETLSSMVGLANCYAALGQYAEAIKLDEEALAVRKVKLGPDHPDTLMSINNLARSYGQSGRYAEAVKLCEEAVALQKSKLGPDHPDTLMSMTNLASGYDALGRQADALKLREQTLALYKVRLGPEHPDTLVTMSNLVVSYINLGRHADALKLGEEVLARRRVKLGPDHPDTLMSMTNLAACYAGLGRNVEALKLYEQTLALQKARLGPRHPDIADTMYSIASVHATMVDKAVDKGKEAALAMDWLRKSVAAGYKDVGQIKQDSDLNSLRDREDFKRLLAELAANADKATK
jgi:serine/threonine protein kinase